MTTEETLIRETIFGEDLTWSVVAVGAGSCDAVLVWLIMSSLDTARSLPTAFPTDPPGLLILATVPMTVGYVFVRNRGFLPTFLTSFLPVYTVYYFLQTHPEYIRAFVHPPPTRWSEVDYLSLGYWLLGLGVAVVLRVHRNASDRGSSSTSG